MGKKVVSTLAICMMAFFFIVGSFTPAPGQEKARKPKGDIVILATNSTFDVRKAYDPHTLIGAAATTIKSLTFDGLVTKDANGVFQPALAESWEIAKDWSSISLKLHKGVQFHNGDPFSAKDVKFSIERVMRDDLRYVAGPEVKRAIDKVEIVNDYFVRIRLKQPYPTFLDRCFESLAIVPKDYIEKVGDDGFAAKPIGTGPFRVVRFIRDVSFDVEAVENHYRHTPYVKTARFKVVPEHSTRLAMLKTGEADVAMTYASLVPLVQKDPNLKIFWSKHTYCISLVFFDLAHPEDSPFKNPLVRKATSLAIDRKAIADATGFGVLEPWGSFLAPYHAGFDAGRKPDPYNPEEAKKLLAQAGYPNGFDTVLTTTVTHKERFEAVQQQLKNVGIRCKLNVPEGGAWSKTFVSANYRGIGYGSGPWWQGRSHPGSAIESHFTGTWGHKLATPEIVKVLDKLVNAVDEKEMAKAAREADDTILASTVRLPLWSTHTPYGARKRVEEYPGVPGVVFPMGFEYLKLKEK